METIFSIFISYLMIVVFIIVCAFSMLALAYIMTEIVEDVLRGDKE